ncbi:hypothetical protein V8E53_005411 [Lactarius tabidus]
MSSTHTPDIKSLFEVALSEYEKRAETSLIESELSAKLKVLTAQTITVVGQSNWHDPIPACDKQFFAGIGILLAAIKGVSASYNAVVELFELIENFLRHTKVKQGAIHCRSLVPSLSRELVKFGKTRKLLGEKDVELLLQKLDRLTQEVSQTAATLTLEVVHDLAKNLKVVMDPSLQYLLVTMAIGHMVPPGDHLFTMEWMTRGSLLWVHGKRQIIRTSSCLYHHRSRFHSRLRESILSSTIIRVIESMQDSVTTSMAFYYFDFRDDEKRNRSLV